MWGKSVIDVIEDRTESGRSQACGPPMRPTTNRMDDPTIVLDTCVSAKAYLDTEL